MPKKHDAPAPETPRRKWLPTQWLPKKWPAPKWAALKASALKWPPRKWVAVSAGVLVLALLAGVGSALLLRSQDPKSSAVSFARAVQANDVAAARAASTGSDEQHKTVEAMSEVFWAFKQYEAAIVARFGDEARGKGLSMPDVVAETEASDVMTVGDTATLVNPKRPGDKNPMKLVRKGRKWYVDLSSMPIDAQTRAMSTAAPKIRKAVDETAAEVRAGKYKTAPEAQASLGQRMQTAMRPG